MSKTGFYRVDPAYISPFGEQLTVQYGQNQYTITCLDSAGIYDTRKLNFNQKVVVYNQVYQKLSEYNGDLNAFIRQSEEFQAWVNEVVQEIHAYAYPQIKAQKFVTPKPVDITALNRKIKTVGSSASVAIEQPSTPQEEILCGANAVFCFLQTNLAECAQLFTTHNNRSNKITTAYLDAGVVVTFVSQAALDKMAPATNHEGFVMRKFPHIIARCDEVARQQFENGKIHKLKGDGDITSMGKGILQTKLPWDDIVVYDNRGTPETRMRYKKINSFGSGSPSNNRTAKDPHAMRVIEGRIDSNDNTMAPHAYAGRAETLDKAQKVVAFVFEQEFSANQNKFLNDLRYDGHFHLSLAIQSLCKTEIPDDGEYKKFTLAEREAYETLVKQKTSIPVTITDANGTKYNLHVILDEVFLSNTAVNGACYFQDRLLPEWWSHRKERSIADAIESDQRLFNKIDAGSFQHDQTYLQVKAQFANRRHLLQPWEELLLREYLYIRANIPAVKHCKSSKDRTGMALAISSALRQWVALSKPIENNDICTLVNNDEFKELVFRKLLPGIASSEYNTMTAGLKLAEPLRDPSLMVFLPDRCKQLYAFNVVFYGFILGLIAFPLVASLGLLTTLYHYAEEQWNSPTGGITLSSPVWEEYWMMFKDLWRMYDIWSHGLTPEAEKLIFGKLSRIDSALHKTYKGGLKAAQQLGIDLSEKNQKLLNEEDQHVTVED